MARTSNKHFGLRKNLPEAHSRPQLVNACAKFALAGGVGALCIASAGRADPASEIDEALRKLGQAPSYAWATERPLSPFGSLPPPTAGTIRIASRSRGSPIAEGQMERLGHTLVTAHFSRPGGAAVGTAARSDKLHVVVETPDGWMTPDEFNAHFPWPRPARLIMWKGKEIYLEDLCLATSAALAAKRPDEELPPLIGDIVAYRREAGEIVGELDEKGVSRLMPRQPKNGPQIRRGLVRFRLVAGELREYSACLIIDTTSQPTKLGVPAPPQVQVLRVTTISGIGSTIVALPDGASARLTP